MFGENSGRDIRSEVGINWYNTMRNFKVIKFTQINNNNQYKTEKDCNKNTGYMKICTTY